MITSGFRLKRLIYKRESLIIKMDFVYVLSLIAGIFLIGGYVPYVYEVIKGRGKPSRMSWFIWSLSTATILFSLGETGTSEAIWVPIADAVGCFAIFILSLKKGIGGFTKTDKISLSIVIASLLIWWFTGNALVALLMNLFIYISGYIPTIKKSIHHPENESRFAWMLFFIGVIINLIVVGIGSDTGFAVWLYPIVLVITVGTLFYFLIREVPKRGNNQKKRSFKILKNK